MMSSRLSATMLRECANAAARRLRVATRVTMSATSVKPLSTLSTLSTLRSCPLFTAASRTFASRTSTSESSSSAPAVPGMLTVEQLKARIQSGEIEQVIMAFPDMYGRLMGKRFDGDFFVRSALVDGTHACDYLLASDMEMNPQPGYEFASWEKGFGDFHMVPDTSSIRVVSWQPATAMVMCDLHDNRTHAPLAVAPRNVLHRQLDAAAKHSYRVFSASELEYYTYETTYREAFAGGYTKRVLKPVGDYYADYHLLQTAREEKYTSAFRKHLKASGIPIENSKGECGVGQHELNVRYSDCLTMSDRHAVYKQCLKEVSDQLGVSVTFMAKPFTDATGSGCHIHLSMFHKNGGNAFVGDEKLGPIKCSKLFKNFLAGWLQYTPDSMVFYAPTVNSYKRFVSASWAPTRLAWSYDNRTAGYRVVGAGTEGLRIEGRIAGADCNIYLAFAASLASGLRGIAEDRSPPPIFEGNIYEARELPQVPRTLTDAIHVFENSKFANESFGEDVVRHYANFYRHEQLAYEQHVTDWERQRYFERI